MCQASALSGPHRCVVRRCRPSIGRGQAFPASRSSSSMSATLPAVQDRPPRWSLSRLSPEPAFAAVVVAVARCSGVGPASRRCRPAVSASPPALRGAGGRGARHAWAKWYCRGVASAAWCDWTRCILRAKWMGETRAIGRAGWANAGPLCLASGLPSLARAPSPCWSRPGQRRAD